MSSRGFPGKLQEAGPYRYLIPRAYKPGMLVDGLVFASADMMESICRDNAPEQVANAACLPGAVGRVVAMPDIHWGYGLPIGGVLATDRRCGVISPGAVGFDINCGVRLLRCNLEKGEISGRLEGLLRYMVSSIPTGVGSSGKIVLDGSQMDEVLRRGAAWAVSQGFGREQDLAACEEGGSMPAADPRSVSGRAKKRGRDQLGTLGSGNHFIEIGYVERLLDPATAEHYGLAEDQVTIMIHSGSRGVGHQVCTDYTRLAGDVSRREGYDLPDRQLAAMLHGSREGREYYAALAAAANFAWANRQCLTHWMRGCLGEVMSASEEQLGLELLYDQAHNIAKYENHSLDGTELEVCVHRKGACRALPAGHPLLGEKYRDVGHPVLVPGDMGSASYVCVGLPAAVQETFASTAHGAGRAMSRSAAKRSVHGGRLREELRQRGILVGGTGDASLAEEAPAAYKDVDEVVTVMDLVGIACKVARLRPLVVLKG